jgi:hypothetical protein
MSYLFERFINDIGMLKVIVGEEVELVQEVADVYTAHGVHL